MADVIIFVYEVPWFTFLADINVDEVSWITLKNYYEVRWNYYKLRQLSLLQSAMDSYYKLRQLFYYKVRHGLLQIATGITKCDDYYKLRQHKRASKDACTCIAIESPGWPSLFKDRFQSCGQQLCKLTGIKKSFYMWRVQFPQVFFCTQTWPPTHCFVHKYGRRDVLWKRSIELYKEPLTKNKLTSFKVLYHLCIIILIVTSGLHHSLDLYK